MAFIAALPEIAEAGAAAGEAGEAAGGAAESSGGSGLFNKIPQPGSFDQGKQQNSGESRNFNFQDAFNTVRAALRPNEGGVD